jgi:hypothetical protein
MGIPSPFPQAYARIQIGVTLFAKIDNAAELSIILPSQTPRNYNCNVDNNSRGIISEAEASSLKVLQYLLRKKNQNTETQSYSILILSKYSNNVEL